MSAVGEFERGDPAVEACFAAHSTLSERGRGPIAAQSRVDDLCDRRLRGTSRTDKEQRRDHDAPAQQKQADHAGSESCVGPIPMPAALGSCNLPTGTLAENAEFPRDADATEGASGVD